MSTSSGSHPTHPPGTNPTGFMPPTSQPQSWQPLISAPAAQSSSVAMPYPHSTSMNAYVTSSVHVRTPTSTFHPHPPHLFGHSNVFGYSSMGTQLSTMYHSFPKSATTGECLTHMSYSNSLEGFVFRLITKCLYSHPFQPWSSLWWYHIQ